MIDKHEFINSFVLTPSGFLRVQHTSVLTPAEKPGGQYKTKNKPLVINTLRMAAYWPPRNGKTVMGGGLGVFPQSPPWGQSRSGGGWKGPWGTKKDRSRRSFLRAQSGARTRTSLRDTGF